MSIGAGYRAVRERVAEAALRAGRRPEDVLVVAVTKTVTLERIREAVEAGARHLGENYVQEARAKRAALAGVDSVAWHLIGGLQKNKAPLAASLFDRIHSLDDLAVARRLDQGARAAGRTIPCLVQVNLAGEPRKGGISSGELAGFLERVAPLVGLTIEGLMTVPPYGADAEASRRHFARLGELREVGSRLRLANVELKHLSMGMSGDFEVAVAEGATIVRLGTAIFGERV